MEFTNPNKQSFKDIMKMADEQNMVIVVIGSGETGSMVEKVINNPKMLAIRMENILEEDQKKFSEKKPLEAPSFPIKNYRVDFPEVVAVRKDDLNKKWYDDIVNKKKKRKF